MYASPFHSWIWHPYPYQSLPANTWAEVMHQQDPFGDEHFGAWFMYAPGSGVHFQLGQTIDFQEHNDAFSHFGAWGNEVLSKEAAAQNYDSIQFLAHIDHVNYQCDNYNTNSGLRYMGLEIVATRLVGTYSCGTKDGAPSEIRAGWHASRPCSCSNKLQYLNCQVNASHSNSSAVHNVVMV